MPAPPRRPPPARWAITPSMVESPMGASLWQNFAWGILPSSSGTHAYDRTIGAGGRSTAGGTPNITGASKVLTRYGGGYESDATDGSDRVSFVSRSTHALAGTTRSTIAILCRIDSINNTGSLVMYPYATGSWSPPYVMMGLVKNGGGTQVRFACAIAGSLSDRPSGAGMINADGSWHLIAASRDRAVTNFYLDGKYHSQHTGGATGAIDAINAPAEPVSIFSRSNSSPGEGFNGQVAAVLFWTDALTAAQHQALNSDIFVMVRPRQLAGLRKSAGGGVTVTVPVAALTLTGLAPTVTTTEHVTIEVPVAALTLTAFAPSVVQGEVIAVPLAALTLTSFAPSIVSGEVIAVGVAALLLTGFAPSVETPTAITVGVAALLLTGLAPTVTVDADVAVTVGVAALLLTGFAPVLAITGGRTVSATVGAHKARTWSATSRIAGSPTLGAHKASSDTWKEGE